MNTLQETFSGAWADTLGWTLLHSFWQGLLIAVLVYISLKLFSSASSQVRYAIACSGMLLTLLASLITFGILFSQHQPETTSVYIGIDQSAKNISGITVSDTFNVQVNNIVNFIDTNMFWVVSIWIAGAFLFSLRLIGGYWYISKLRNHAQTIDNAWSEKLQALADELQITKAIHLAESALINSPMVIGYLKPIVLVPLGMFNGLTTAELETIFLHELAHIKRHDYLINLIQSFIEVVFFFNPFIWILSGIVRDEREFACDDTVIRKHGNALAYAQALARLEESRISGNILALALADNKNQLLNRIKRIMERSFKPQMERNRIVPLVLLVVGLLCASWLTIRNDEKTVQQNITSYNIADTTKKKTEKSSSYYKKSITTIDENGEPHEVIVEDFDGDFPIAPIPVIAGIPPIPNMHSIPPIPVIAFDAFYFDTIPGRSFHYRTEEWEKFSEVFEDQFKERFNDFYETHEADFTQMMKEMEEHFQHEFTEEKLQSLQEQVMKHAKLAGEFPQVEEAMHAQQLALQAQQAAMHDGWEKEHAAEMKAWAEEMKGWEKANSERMAAIEKNMKAFENNTKVFEKELKEQLIEDSYLAKDEELKNIHWKANGDIEINGKEIKAQDKKKYNALHDKYFEGREFHRIE
jgi:beta-lactamase regulating signal transducer with metallopeptidase domain